MMAFEEFAADLPQQYTQWFDTPVELEAALKDVGVYQPTRQAKRGEFRAGLAYRKSEFCELFSDRYSTALSLHLESPKGDFGILIPRTPSNHFVTNGIDLGDDHLAVAPLGAGMDISGPGPIGSDCITIPPARFIELLEVLCPSADFPDGLTLIKVFPPERVLLGDLIVNLIGSQDVDVHGERFGNLMAWTVSLIGHASRQYRPEKVNGLRARSEIAKGIQEYIEENYQSPVHLEDLCRNARYGIRTLQRCFREYFDVTITDYLKTVRLDAAYRELAAADAGDRSVTGVAMKNGFTHLGRFSIAYRVRFGEAPSETLTNLSRN